MSLKKRISPETRSAIRILKTTTDLTFQEIAQRCDVSTTSAHRIATAPEGAPESRRHLCGRKRKLLQEQEELLVNSISDLREQEGSFTSRRLMEKLGIRHVSDRTVRRALNRNKYFFLQARKKGLMNKDDRQKRVTFAQRMQTEFPPNVWKDMVAFYLDGVSFVYKTNPLDQARAPSGRVWRKKTEGLRQGCLSRGSKAGTGRKLAKFIVAISYSKGVVLCERYEKMNGAFFSSFIDEHFDNVFARAGKGASRLWLQDGDPSQNSRAARDAMARCRAELLKIPPRSPDLNPIENFFHIVSMNLRKGALEERITRETYAEFCTRIKRTMNDVPREIIDRTIESMNARVDGIILNQGERLKY